MSYSRRFAEASEQGARHVDRGAWVFVLRTWGGVLGPGENGFGPAFLGKRHLAPWAGAKVASEVLSHPAKGGFYFS